MSTDKMPEHIIDGDGDVWALRTCGFYHHVILSGECDGVCVNITKDIVKELYGLSPLTPTKDNTVTTNSPITWPLPSMYSIEDKDYPYSTTHKTEYEVMFRIGPSSVNLATFMFREHAVRYVTEILGVQFVDSATEGAES